MYLDRAHVTNAVVSIFLFHLVFRFEFSLRVELSVAHVVDFHLLKSDSLFKFGLFALYLMELLLQDVDEPENAGEKGPGINFESRTKHLLFFFKLEFEQDSSLFFLQAIHLAQERVTLFDTFRLRATGGQVGRHASRAVTFLL